MCECEGHLTKQLGGCAIFGCDQQPAIFQACVADASSKAVAGQPLSGDTSDVHRGGLHLSKLNVAV